MDLNPCITVVMHVGQSLMCFTLPKRCKVASNDLELQVMQLDGTLIAAYDVHGIDSKGACFYVDETINSATGSYRFSLLECRRVVMSGSIVVTVGRVVYVPQSPKTECYCEGC